MELSKLILFSVNLHLGRDAERGLVPFIANFMALTASTQTTAEGAAEVWLSEIRGSAGP